MSVCVCVCYCAPLFSVAEKWLQSSESQINCSIIVTAEPLQAKTRVHTVIEGKLDPLVFTSQTGKRCLSSLLKSSSAAEFCSQYRAVFIFIFIFLNR